MPGRLQSEIRQTRPFPHPAEEAFLNLHRTADWLLRGVEETLRAFRLSTRNIMCCASWLAPAPAAFRAAK